MRERDLHRQVVAFLRVALPPDALFAHVPNEGKRGWVAQRDFHELGAYTGFPDLLVIHRGRALLIELKSRKGWIRPEQKAAHRKLRDAGCPVIVARSLADVEMFLTGEGVPLAARIAA